MYVLWRDSEILERSYSGKNSATRSPTLLLDLCDDAIVLSYLVSLAMLQSSK